MDKPTATAVTSDGEPLLYRVPAARKKVGVGNTMFYELMNSGRIRSVKIGRARLIPADALRDFVASLSGEAQ